MSTTVNDYIEAFTEEHENDYDNVVFLKWINLVEANVYTDIIKEHTVKYYAKAVDEYQYSLPSGVNFADIKTLHINGYAYKKKDVQAHNEMYTFWYEGSKLCIYPACQDTDTTYTSDAGEITFATNTITTTGDNFAFAVGDVVLVSGCTVNTTNNKHATIIAKTDTVLTFAAGTFTAGLETGVVVISKPTIKMVYLSLPAEKLTKDIETDILTIPMRFQEIYDYFILAKIAYNNKEYGEYQNHMTMYNTRVMEYEKWWEDNRPLKPMEQIQVDYSVSDYNSSTYNFDHDI